jgi:outer membrane protein, multidrug efflux system
MSSLPGRLMVACLFTSCIPTLQQLPRSPNTAVPSTFANGPQPDAGVEKPQQTELMKWSDFFRDPHLVALMQDALQHNQELNMARLEMVIAQSELMARNGELFPRLSARLGVGLDRSSQNTSQGVSDDANKLPNLLQDYSFGLMASWEVDIWGKLRKASKAAALRYLASTEGQKFTTTLIVAEIARAYYELNALDAQLEVISQNIEIQKNALTVVRLQKNAARGTELAVKRFEAEVLKIEARRYTFLQRIVESENRVNFLLGRFPQHIDRSNSNDLEPVLLQTGLPVQLLENRPDVKRAELEMTTAGLDVEVAKARFYPALELRAGLGYQSFDITQLLATPASLLYNLAGEIFAPLLNRTALTSNYMAANSRQMQAVYSYERAILNGYTESVQQLATLTNLQNTFALKSREVETLNEASHISLDLFASARADYMEVLTTRRDALEAQVDLTETKMKQQQAVISLYQALGGGWK